MQKDKTNKNMVFTIAILVLLVVANIFVFLHSNIATVSEDNTQETDEAWDDTILLDGVTYCPNSAIEPILFLGVDKTSLIKSDNMVSNNGRADTVTLFILNRDTKTVKVLQIPRDTMVNVQVYKGNGEYAYTDYEQINMQYAYGEDDHNSCLLVRKRVSELLYGVEVDNYISLTIDGISKFVDAMGGVSVTMQGDCTEIDPSYVNGAKIFMDGSTAERFVRYRDIEQVGSNSVRVEHQSWFVKGVVDWLTKQKRSTSKIEKIVNATGDNLRMNIDENLLSSISEYQVEAFQTIPGAYSDETGLLYDEYIPDDEALQRLVIELFYSPVQ